MRKPRVLLEGATYHVMSRTVHKSLWLDDRAAKTMFMNVLERAKRLFSFDLINFTIMGNHFHFLIRPGRGESLSRIMKWIAQTVAINYNKRHGTWGHFWGSRFLSWIVPNLKEFLRVFHYIDENPCQARLVRRPEDWPWGALHLRRSGWLAFLVSTLPFWLRPWVPGHAPLLLPGPGA